MRRFSSVLSLVLVVSVAPLGAQHAYSEAGSTYDPRVPTPRAVLGHDIGERFTTHRAMTRYLEHIAATTKRVRVDTVDAASAWLAQETTRLARLRVRRDTTRADSAGGAPLQTDLPGVIARATIDTLSPLLAGVCDLELPVFAESDRVFTVPEDLTAGEAVIRFAARDRVRLAGYFWPEMPERLALSPWLWTERVGRGRVIAFAHDVNYRDLFRGLLPVFGNAVLLGGTF